MRRRITTIPSLAFAGGALAVGAGGLYLAGLLLAGGEIAAGTTVHGVDIGGLSRAEATLKLDKHLSAAGSRKPTVRVADHSGEFDSRQAGLAFDVRQTVDRAAGSRTDPFAVIGGLFRSGGDTGPTARVDGGKARTALEKLGESLNEKARDGAVTFGNGQVNDIAPHDGYALDVDAAVDTLRTAFLSGKADSVTVLRTSETKPKITAAETRRAVREFAQPAMSAPVTLTAGGKADYQPGRPG